MFIFDWSILLKKKEPEKDIVTPIIEEIEEKEPVKVEVKTEEKIPILLIKPKVERKFLYKVPPPFNFVKDDPVRQWALLFNTQNREEFLEQLATYIYSSPKDNVKEQESGLQTAVIKYNNEDRLIYYYDFQSCNTYSLHIIKELLTISPERLIKYKDQYIKRLHTDYIRLSKLMGESRYRPFGHQRWSRK